MGKQSKDLLREAIADAKTIKETAIANAKEALTESFTPHLRSMLSAKLEEMENEDEDIVDEEMDFLDEDNIEEETIDLDELMNDVESLDENEEVEGEDVEGEEDNLEDEDEEIDLEDMSEEDLTSFIEDIINDMVEAGELEPGEGAEDEEDEEFDLDAVEDEEEVNEGNFSGAQNDVPDLQGIIDFFKNSPEKLKSFLAAIKDLPAAASYAIHREGQGNSLRESIKTINSLKKELKEVNLLNAKLLYVNKIFKSQNLTETKKLKVLKSFDKAETIKETKLLFEALTSNLYESKKNRKSMIREIKSSASKASGIRENQNSGIVQDDAFKRLRELAFYNSKR